jgi:hypothetical protein
MMLSPLAISTLLVLGCASEDVEAWCARKAAEESARLTPVYRPSGAEIERGNAAFIRECMKNPGR